MKKLLKLLIIVVIISSFALVSSADEDIDDYLSDFEELLPEDTGLDSLEPSEVISSLGVESLFGLIFDGLSGEGGEVLSFFFLLLASIAFCALASSISDKYSDTAGVALGILISAIVFSRVAPLFSEVLLSLSRINGFFASLSPLMVSLTLAGGAKSTAAVQSVGAGVIISFVQLFTGKIFTSVVAIALAMSALSAIGDGGISSIVGGIKSLFVFILGIATTVLSASLGLQTMIAGSADSASMRAAKYAASSMIPMVGSSISGALSTLASGLSYVKGIVGGVSVFVIVGYFLSPLIMLLLYRLALSVGVSLAEFVGTVTAKKIFTSFRFSLDALIAVYSLSALLYIFEIVLFVKSGVALL